MTDEESTTSQTGGRKITKPQQFSLIPPGPLWELAEHFAKGAEKYGAHNVRAGYEWSKMYDAAMRHLTAFWSGEDRDEETGSKHLAAVAFYALLLMEFMETHPEYDDRYRPNPQPVDLDVDNLTSATFIPGLSEEAVRNALANHPKGKSC